MDFITKKGKQIVIRQPKATDLEEITNFFNNLVQEDIYILRYGQKVTLPEERKWLSSSLKSIKENKMVMLQAWYKNKLAGQIQITKGEFRKRFIGTIHIGIDKDFRGEGIGEELMKRAEKEAEKIEVKILELTVFEENEPALNLYKKMGLEKFGQLPKSIEFRGKMLDEVFMYKRLSP